MFRTAPPRFVLSHLIRPWSLRIWASYEHALKQWYHTMHEINFPSRGALKKKWSTFSGELYTDRAEIAESWRYRTKAVRTHNGTRNVLHIYTLFIYIYISKILHCAETAPHWTSQSGASVPAFAVIGHRHQQS